MTYLVPPPPSFALPLSLGDDFDANFVYKPLVVDGSGNPVLDANGNRQYAAANYPSGASVVLEIDTTPQVTANATISGSVASISIPHSVADTIPKSSIWRVKLVQGSTVQVLANGKTTRKDY